MSELEYTLTSPLSDAVNDIHPLLALTIVWHVDAERIGEQFVGGSGAQTVEVGRFQPLFSRPLGDALPLGHRGISRDPLRIVRSADDSVCIAPSQSRMVVELNGTAIAEPVFLSPAQVGAGAILGLGRAIIVCIHWMHCLPRNNPIAGMFGVGASAIRLRDMVRQAAAGALPVLLLGETGTGKEVAARAIHDLSSRAAHAMVSINMAALNESLAAADLFGAVRGAYTGASTARSGLFAEAQGGTLFLDEIGNTPAAVQPMLLRVLENGQYRPLGAQQDVRADVRLIAATDQDVYAPEFNQPLLRRLEGFLVRLPPLRARREDIGVLIVHFLDVQEAVRAPGLQLPYEFVSACANYGWPGNIRQLAHVMVRAMLALAHGQVPVLHELADTPRGSSAANIGHESADGPKSEPGPVRDLAADRIASVLHQRKRLADVSEQDALDAMENNGWYIQAAAQQLGISRPSMYKLIESNSQIRRAEQIAPDDILQAYRASGGALEKCASLLKTPSEALRRRLGALGLSAHSLI